MAPWRGKGVPLPPSSGGSGAVGGMASSREGAGTQPPRQGQAGYIQGD